MQTSKRLYHMMIHSLCIMLLSLLFSKSLAQENSTILCGKIKILPPLAPQNPLNSSISSRMVFCKSEKLYFRTTLGLFSISSIDYKAKLLIISHNSSSSLASSNFISPSNLSSGFPPPPQPNSLILLNCSESQRQNNPVFRNCKDGSFLGSRGSHSCLVVEDVGNLDMGFHPKDLNCSGYSRVYRNGSSGNFEVGTRLSYDIPDHVPNPCHECEKKDGNCGAGLRCICHPKDCRNNIVSSTVTTNPLKTIFILSLLFLDIEILM